MAVEHTATLLGMMMMMIMMMMMMMMTEGICPSELDHEDTRYHNYCILNFLAML
jgi:hypothetical protein